MQHGNRFGLQKGVRCVLLCGASRVAGRGGAARVTFPASRSRTNGATARSAARGSQAVVLLRAQPCQHPLHRRSPAPFNTGSAKTR
eukprot:scaffold15098_cov70-Phaeocystis_antarctica.AAC.1